MIPKLFVVVWICIAAIFDTGISSEECGDGYIPIDIKGSCTNSTCLGECRNENSCCLEMCFVGNRPTSEELEGCATEDGVESTCSNFANQTECLADNLNKTTDACWRHTIYYISTHPGVTEISGFNPMNCPCENGQTRVEGDCLFSQCVNSSNCQLNKDQFRDITLCCLDEAIFPLESDCGDHETLDKSVNNRLVVSTLAECQNVCQEGLCKMPDPNRFPACCRETKRRTVKQTDDESLHESVIAVIITLIVIVLIAGVFGGYYLYSRRKQDNSRKIDSNASSIEITGVDEMMGAEQAWQDDHANFSAAANHKKNFFYANQEPEVDSSSAQDLDGNLDANGKFKARDNKFLIDNHIYSIDTEHFDDAEVRRTGNSASSRKFES